VKAVDEERSDECRRAATERDERQIRDADPEEHDTDRE
jgi:hypothetical protein